MGLLRTLNTSLGRTLGYEIRRVRSSGAATHTLKTSTASGKSHASAAYNPPDPNVDRLLRRPIFVLASVRSGSTLLRLLLNGHPQLHAPHELHLRRIQVHWKTKIAAMSMKELGLDRGDLEHLLWDRIMHRELVKSGKSFIVEKTPSNALAWRRFADSWPDARFIFMLRHPLSIARSWHEADPEKWTLEEAGSDALRYMNAIESARNALDGYTVRYEDLTDEPIETLKGVCAFLGVEWEPAMLDYGRHVNAELAKYLGDWREKVHSGTVQPGRPLPHPAEIPDYLRPISHAWGYLTDQEDLSTTAWEAGHAS